MVLATFGLLLSLASATSIRAGAEAVVEDQQVLADPPPPSSSLSPSSSLPPYQPALNFTSPFPHLFSSVSTLLHQFSNTIFPTGHALSPCLIPPYVLLHHGRRDSSLPASPEWLAFDIEMSYGITGSSRSSFMLTYQTTRQVPCLYFDGMSAALMGFGGGQLDSQMLHLFGNVTGPPRPDDGGFRGLYDEYLRAQKLCDWLSVAGLRGRGWGVEGVVRMNAGFEVIWCDFASPSLRLISRANVTAPEMPESEPESSTAAVGVAASYRPGHQASRPEIEDWDMAMGLEYSLPPLPSQPTTTSQSTDPSDPPRPPNWERNPSLEPFRKSQGWGWFLSATYHYGSTRSGPGVGEDRARIQSCGLVSWYSPRLDGGNASLARGIEERERLNLTREGLWAGPGEGDDMTEGLQELRRRRRFHQLEHATREEAMLLRKRSEIALRELLDGGNKCSGVDWVLMTREIVQRTAELLKVLESQTGKFPEHTTNETAVRTWLQDLRAQSHLFLMPYLEYPPHYVSKDWVAQSELYNETYSRCRYRYTRLLANDQGISLLEEEQDLKWAVEETHGTICQVLISVGFEAESSWAETFGRGLDKKPALARAGKELMNRSQIWGKRISELIAWLGWENEYIGCEEACEWDERCYIPMWPLIHRDTRRFPPRNGTGPPPGHGLPPGLLSRSPDGPLPGPGHPPYGIPPRGPGWMEDDTDLWEPKCVKASYIMGDA